MRFKHTLAACATAMAALLVPLAATPAAAATPTTGDSVEATDFSFSGSFEIGWRVGPNKLDPVKITLRDQATDGYAIGARLITGGENGKIVWRMRTIPTGQDTASWTTYAAPGGWINYAYFEVCKVKVSNGAVSYCHTTRVMNNPISDDDNVKFPG
ncbi:hypothetical protein M5362_31170 [Streptomyces sp. Je 1-79]|uniref:hypothetical protein n=1 Tax=Streptomyces sp. Je 1-79 TaxID=2943847 RepID=UPI0021A37683|nr:hypothetical protein [Streptomyces sp. Je 1-79]MCT4357568.1 hypothetical protein [Streptomyces sp. Je 1-79]